MLKSVNRGKTHVPAFQAEPTDFQLTYPHQQIRTLKFHVIIQKSKWVENVGNSISDCILEYFCDVEIHIPFASKQILMRIPQQCFRKFDICSNIFTFFIWLYICRFKDLTFIYLFYLFILIVSREANFNESTLERYFCHHQANCYVLTMNIQQANKVFLQIPFYA